MANPAIAGYATYAFADDGDVALHSRLAADAVGATKMDRPEWCGVHPTTGEVYFTMTNNSNRRLAPSGSQLPLNAANPRAYTDIRGASTTQQGNVNGHIVRLKESGGEPTATAFQWDVYLFGAESGASPTLINLSGLTDDQDFSSPDGLVFSPSTGLCWIQTDDGAYTDVTNCMMLAALPGPVGDGGDLTLDYGTATVTTKHGQEADGEHAQALLRRPRGQRDHRPVRDAGRQGDVHQRAAPWRGHAAGRHRRPGQVRQPLARQRRLRCRRRQRPPALGHGDDHQERRRSHRQLTGARPCRCLRR